MAFCAQCGTQIADGAQFCAVCGAPVGETTPNQNVQAQQAATYQQPMQGTQGVPNGQPYGQPNGQPNGVPNGQPNGQPYGQPMQGPANNFVNKFTNTPDFTGEFHPQDIAQNKAMGVLAYLGILVLFPIFAAKESRFARYHANQGLVLIIAGACYGFVQFILTLILGAIFPIRWDFTHFGTRSGIFTVIVAILALVWLIYAAAMILGIVNAVNGKAKELPIIGKIKILK